MVAQRVPGAINPQTTLIDIGMGNCHGIASAYLIQGARSCLIDAGTRQAAPRLIKQLRALNAFPPDMIVVTHPHWDHTQGIPVLRQAAAAEGRTIEVIAARRAIPLLADATFNNDFGGGPHLAVLDVSPVDDGARIDLGGIQLRIIGLPGHSDGQIAILDETHGNICVGDAIGDKLADDIFLPPFMPRTWDAPGFSQAIETLRQTPYETLCLTHFGCISGPEARTILDEALDNCRIWWEWFDKHADHLHQTRRLLLAMRSELDVGIPRILPMHAGTKLGLGILTTVASLFGRRTRVLDRLYFCHAIEWLARGYTMSRSH
ncbi:MAG: MBL fold metallo-hydrolase [Planctomycetes bacterium]|nr:MBL fold metallo-hydrolase [Planctomycetota bacterium]